MKSTTITVYPKVRPLLTKVKLLYPGKTSILFNLGFYKLLTENEDIDRLLEEAEKLLK